MIKPISIPGIISCILVLCLFVLPIKSYCKSGWELLNVVKDSTTELSEINDHIKINGKVITENNIAINDVKISMFGPEYFRDKKVDENGFFAFNDLIEENNYEIHVLKEGKGMEGISVMDMVYLKRHLNDIKKISSPYKILAADMDFSSDLTLSDLDILRKFVLGVNPIGKMKRSWQFINATSNMHNEEVAVMGNTSGTLQFIDLTKDKLNSNFIGVKTGDVNGSMSDIYSANISDSVFDVLKIKVSPVLFEATEFIEIPIYANKSFEISALQLAMEFDESVFDILEILPGSIDLKNEDYVVGNNDLRIAFAPNVSFNINDRDPLFTIKVATKSSGKASKQLALSSVNMESIAYDKDEGPLFIQTHVEEEEPLTVLQNTPNPFIETTEVKFSLVEAMPIEITIFDALGNQIFNKYEIYSKGVHSVSIGNEMLVNNTGVFVVHVESAEMTKAVKMLRIK